MMPTSQGPDAARAMPSATFEFDDAQNATLRGLTRTMRVAAVLTLAQCVGAIAQAGWTAMHASVTTLIGAAIGAAIALMLNGFLGLWTLSAAAAIERVVTTQGNDVPNLMAAIVKLGELFRVLRVLCIILIALMVVACVAGVAIAASGLSH